MEILSKGDERKKLVLFIIATFLGFSICTSLLVKYFINEVNKNYITQNMMIISSLEEGGSVESILPIITGKTRIPYQKGKEILKEYSYSEELSYSLNPLFEESLKTLNVNMVGVTFVFMAFILFAIFLILKPLYGEVAYLTKRADFIVEDKELLESHKKYKGSLDKFIVKFNLMEDRVKNSILLLKEEKINLKNIINDITHQLKTPLMALSMYNDILVDHENMEKTEIDEFLTLSKEQLERMDWLVKTLLKYARLESNVVEYHKEYFSLNNTIEESLNPLLIKAEEKNQTLFFKHSNEISYYHDRKWVGEALSNIIKNAIEHTGEGGKIEVFLEETPISISIGVKDNGEGIEKSELKKIFNRFHKGQNALNPRSIGIGLCLSKSIIRAHSGDITVESTLGKGSTFYITFLKGA